MFEYIIIGAGVTGLTLCKKLREKGIDNILVLEKEKEAGGLCRTRNIDGHTLDIGGGHFFTRNIRECLTMSSSICRRKNSTIIKGFLK